MRALVVSAWEPWKLTDGAVWTLHHHLRCLGERHEIAVLAAGAADHRSPLPPEARTLPEGVTAEWFGTPRPPGMDYALRRLASERSGEPAQVHWVQRPALVAALRERVDHWRPHVVHTFGWGTAQLHRQVRSTPIVNFANDSWDLNYGVRRLPGWRSVTDVGQHAKARRHERRHYPHLGAVMVVAPHDADHIRALAPAARVEVVATGVDAGPDPAPIPAAPVLGFHGSYEAGHNVDAALALVNEVLPRVRKDIAGTRVLLVGRSPTAEIRALAGPDVEIRSDVADVRSELDRMTVYVACMSSGSGLKHKVLEAMAAGRPVVATPLGWAGIGPGPGLLDGAGPAEVAREVVGLLRDRDRLMAEGAAARARMVEEFTWERSARRVEDVWRDLQP